MRNTTSPTPTRPRSPAKRCPAPAARCCYAGPANSEVAEVQFFGADSVPIGMTGTTAGSFDNDGDAVIVDLKSAKTVSANEFAPRSRSASRMVGDVFEASDTSASRRAWSPPAPSVLR